MEVSCYTLEGFKSIQPEEKELVTAVTLNDCSTVQTIIPHLSQLPNLNVVDITLGKPTNLSNLAEELPKLQLLSLGLILEDYVAPFSEFLPKLTTLIQINMVDAKYGLNATSEQVGPILEIISGLPEVKSLHVHDDIATHWINYAYQEQNEAKFAHLEELVLEGKVEHNMLPPASGSPWSCMPWLKRLNINRRFVDGGELILKDLRYLVGLTHLDLFGMRIGDLGAVYMAHALPHFTNLESLVLAFNFRDVADMFIICSELHNLKQLQVLNIRNNNVSQGGATLAKSLTCMKRLRVLDARSCGLNDEDFPAIMLACASLNLEELYLTGNAFYQPQVSGLSTLGGCGLRVLFLGGVTSWSAESVEFVAQLLSQATELRELDLSETPLQDSVAVLRSMSQLPNLERLHLSRCQLSIKVMNAFFQMVVSDMPHLRYLGVGGNQLDVAKLEYMAERSGLTILYAALHGRSKPITRALSRNKIRHATLMSLTAFPKTRNLK